MSPRGRRWVLIAAPLLAAVVLWGWWSGSLRVRKARRELAELEARRQQLEETRRTLSREVEALHTDREARARAARESLDVAAPGEVLVVVAEPTPVSGVAPGVGAGEPGGGVQSEPTPGAPTPAAGGEGEG